MTNPEHYGALPTADKIRVNAAIMYSMKQDLQFCKAFLAAVDMTEKKLNNADRLPSFGRNRDEAYQQVIDSLRSVVSENSQWGNLQKIPPAKGEREPEFDLAAQQAVFRGSRSIKEPLALLEYMGMPKEPNVVLNGKTYSTKDSGYSLPKSDMEKQEPDSEQAIDLKQFMRQKMGVAGAGRMIANAGVNVSTGNAVATAPAQRSERGIS